MKHPAKPRIVRELATASQRLPALAPLLSALAPRFPHISDRIELLWGTWDLQQYLTRILFKEDRPNRHGFPTDIMSVLLKVYDMHSIIAPKTDPKAMRQPSPDPWAETVYRVPR